MSLLLRVAPASGVVSSFVGLCLIALGQRKDTGSLFFATPAATLGVWPEGRVFHVAGLAGRALAHSLTLRHVDAS